MGEQDRHPSLGGSTEGSLRVVFRILTCSGGDWGCFWVVIPFQQVVCRSPGPIFMPSVGWDWLGGSHHFEMKVYLLDCFPCFSESELSPWFLLVHRERALWDSLQDIHRPGKCITHCGLFLPNCHASFQHSACCHYMLSVDWFSLNPWLMAFCSNAHRADYPSLSAYAPILLAFFVSVWMWEK